LSWEQLNNESLGVRYVRGCEVMDVLDEEKKIIGAFDAEGNKHVAKGNMRIYRVQMDAAQYQIDVTKVVESNAEDPYKTFNLLMRRKPEENNFKAVLETMRDLMQSESSVPPWLRDVFLGSGEPDAAQYWRLTGGGSGAAAAGAEGPTDSAANASATNKHRPQQLDTLHFSDTFLDYEHLVRSFPGAKVSLRTAAAAAGASGGGVAPTFPENFPTWIPP